MNRRFKLLGGPLDGETVDFPWAISVTEFYVHMDPTGQYVERYHACMLNPDDDPEPAYKWMGTEEA